MQWGCCAARVREGKSVHVVQLVYVVQFVYGTCERFRQNASRLTLAALER